MVSRSKKSKYSYSISEVVPTKGSTKGRSDENEKRRPEKHTGAQYGAFVLLECRIRGEIIGKCICDLLDEGIMCGAARQSRHAPLLSRSD